MKPEWKHHLLSQGTAEEEHTPNGTLASPGPETLECDQAPEISTYCSRLHGLDGGSYSFLAV